MGTSVGLSGAYIATALKANGSGKLITLEGCPSTAKLAEDTFLAVGVADMVSLIVGPFQSTLAGVLEEQSPFGLVFIDGHHQREPTLAYFEQIRAHLSPEAVVIFDDIRWSEGMREAWQDVCAMRDLETVDMGDVGAVRIKA
jgi:predicted O-methyltransferase YrrM